MFLASMTSGEVRLGPDTIKQISNEVSTGRSDFTSMAKKLEGQILDKTAQWQGAGGSAFFNLHAAWMEKQNKIVNALNEFEQNLITTEKDNVSTDDAQQSSMTALQNSLGALPNGR